MQIKPLFRTTLRHLWRNRVFTGLNILGLAIGISACWMIYRICSHEFAYDRNLPGLDQTYKVITQSMRNDQEYRMGGVAAPLYQGIRQELTGWEQVVPVFSQWVNSVTVNRPDGKGYSKDEPTGIVAVDRAYFELVPHHWIHGNPETSLNSPENVVLTKSRVQEYFPDLALEEVLNQQILYDNGDSTYRSVSGIVMDYEGPSEFGTTKEFIVLMDQVHPLNTWTNTNGSDKLYVKLRKNTDPDAFLAQLDALDRRHWTAFEKERGSELPKNKSYELLPLKEAHFATHVSDWGVEKMSKPVLFGLIGVGLFLLILACINYINMSIAQIPERAREIGVRKTMGSSPGQLMGQFLFETLLTGLVAIVLALIIGRVGFWWLQELIPAGVDPGGNMGIFMIFALMTILMITLLAGLYPGWLSTKVKTVEVFKNSFSSSPGKNRLGLQKILILFQFTIAIVFISSTIIVGAQLRHTIKAEMGFDKEAVVLVEIPFKYWYNNNPAYKNKQFTLLEELRKQPGIRQISLANPPLSSGYSSSPFSRMDADGTGDPQEAIMYKKTIDTAYLNLYDMQLLSGRNIRPSDTLNEFIINETAARSLGFADPQEAIGQLIGQRGQTKFPVAGVVQDFHTQDFYTPITSLVMMAGNINRNTFNIKLDGNNPAGWQRTLETIQQQWNKFYPADAYNVKFYDETIEAMYAQEQKIAKLINLATGITILISCLGLFGLAALSAYRKTKEIGIRKVLGASVAGIVGMLSKDFVKLVLLATLIASPIAWWAMSKWLEDFVYQVEIQWWMFALAGFSAVLIALATVSWQAIRAAVANPVDSLRDE